VSYITLGSRQVAAAADSTGLNPGNYTAFFATQIVNVNIPYFELYSASVTGVPSALFTITVYVNNAVRSTAQLFGNSEWDPSQPILLVPGDQVTFAFSLAATGTPPEATIWLRYDPAINPTGPGGMVA
jgi:hypothetical protein